MPLDLDAIKARLAAATPGPWRHGPETDAKVGNVVDFGPPPTAPFAVLYCADTHAARAQRLFDATLVAHAPTDIAALIAEVERLRALIPAPPKTPPPGEVWRHSGVRCIDSTEFYVDFIMVGTHTIEAYYPSSNECLRDRCGYSPHPVIWVDGAIYWEDGLIATEQEEDFCAEVVEALIRHIQEHGEPPDDFGDLGLDTFGRDVGIEVSGG